MTVAYEGHGVTVHIADALDVLAGIADASVDAVVTDPPYGLEFMGKEWDAPWKQGADVHAEARNRRAEEMGDENKRRYIASAVNKYAAGLPFQQWCEMWATECLRVLKPGGHLLAFGGTRTWHRLACAVEDAGFEVRDSIAWLYGSGFPKSLDVSKAIDKAAGAEREVVGLGQYANRGRVASGSQVDVGDSAASLMTAPATPAAEQWEGWGTALKPSFEGIVCATKPVPALARIGSRLDELEQSCIPPASGAVPSSAPTHPDSLGARAASAPASAAIRREAAPARTTPTGAAGGSSAATATSASELTGATFWNTVTSWKACWAELCEATSTSTTGTTSSTTTDLETLWSCLSQITPESTTTDPTSPDGLSSLVGAVDAMFAAAVLNSRATRTLTAIGSATSGTPPTSPAAGGSRAAFEPVVVARKPLAGTVAATVLAHGTGALNIDGCRIGLASGEDVAALNARSGGRRGFASEYVGGTDHPLPPGADLSKGRWPANVVLDESQAEALDEQSGTTQARIGKPRGADSGDGWGMTATGAEYDDMGGASRFMYVAKAPTSERPRYKREGGSDNATTYGQMKKRECNVCGNRTCPAGGEQSGKPWPTCGHDDWSWVEQQSARDEFVSHPIVKPLDLMRWLVRLVTPPGGLVLDPFAGSGTTAEACILEGFRCVTIDKEPEHLPLILQRINRQRDPVEAIRQRGEDLGLFDHLEAAP